VDPTGEFIRLTTSKDENQNKGQDLKDLTRRIARKIIANPIAVAITQRPIPFFEQLFSIAGFYKNSDGLYIAKQNAWQQIGGYNKFYDTVFDHATSKASVSFPFTSGGTEYIIWAWKGDYLNLGAGAEIAIYSNRSGVFGINNVTSPHEKHWLVDTNLAMHMTLTLVYNGQTIISWDPKKDLEYRWDKVWWLAGFNPFVQEIDIKKLSAIYTITFNTKSMFDSFFFTYGKGDDRDSRWSFNHDTVTATFRFK